MRNALLLLLSFSNTAMAFECVFKLSDTLVYKVTLDENTNHLTVQHKYSGWHTEGFAVRSGRYSYTYYLQWTPTDYFSLTRMWEPNKNPTCLKDQCGICEDSQL